LTSLSFEAREIRKKITKEWSLSSHEKILLQMAMESFDSMRRAQKIIEEEGLVQEDSQSKKYLHPASIQAKVSENNFQRYMKAIGFIEGVKRAKRTAGRPPGQGELNYGRDKRAND